MPNISHGSVATRFGCGGIFNNEFTTQSQGEKFSNIDMQSAFGEVARSGASVDGDAQ